MLNGYSCASGFILRSAPFNQTVLDQAIAVLRQFYFVGIFERYNESISALHYLANNGRSRPHKVYTDIFLMLYLMLHLNII
jgi:hypothetical protein